MAKSPATAVKLLWYDVMTSRETLVAVLLLISMLTAGSYFTRIVKITNLKIIIILGVSVLGIAAVRTSMLLPLFSSILLMVILIGNIGGMTNNKKILVIFISFGIFIFSQFFNEFLGGNAVDISEGIRQAVTAKDNVALSGDMQFTENSISLLLMPEGILQAILYLPLRIILYLVYNIL